MSDLMLTILGRLLVAGILLSIGLVRGARQGPHRLWLSAVFIGAVTALLESTSDYGIPIYSAECISVRMPFGTMALASGACALTVQALRSSRVSVPWQLGAGTVAAQAALMTGIGFW
jgi:hypothetical protein